MKSLHTQPSYSLTELRLLPRLTQCESIMNRVSLTTKLCRQGDGFINLAIPMVSAAMQAVSGEELAITLAQLGGVSVLPLGASLDDQLRQLKAVKHFKAGFQTDIITLSPEQPLTEVTELIKANGITTFPVTDNGVFHGKLMGVITDKDFDGRYDTELKVADRMRTDMQVGVNISDLKEANRLMISYGRGFLPIVSSQGTLKAVVFKKDLDKHISHPNATIDTQKRLRVGAAISTHEEDRERIEALVEQSLDFLAIDASDGFSIFQKNTLEFVKERYDVPVIAGNIVTKEACEYLLDAGADAIKVGMGIGSGCTTQEAKATGRGQATAIINVVAARDEFHRNTGSYVPIIADGSINTPADIAIALALGADTVMMGNYFARCSESPGKIHNRNGKELKEYWMEGSARAKNLRRYAQTQQTFFEEGISGFVPHAGSALEVVPVTIQQLKSSLSTAGCASVEQLHSDAELELQSTGSLRASGIHNMVADSAIMDQ
jgi:IMP dehydrogenase